MENFVASGTSIDLNQIAVFVRVVDSGSFTAAAASLGLPKSSVSRKLAALEESLGARLLHRTTRRLRLTDAGQRYFRQARQALRELDEAGAEFASLEAAPRGNVRVSAADFEEGRFGEVIAAFVRQHPQIHVDLTMTGRRVDLVAEGYDLAVRAGFLEDSSLVARRVARSELKLYAAPAYVARRGTPRRFADLTKHDCIVYRSSKGILPWRLTRPLGSETVQPSGPVTVDDMSFVRRMVLAGVGIGLLPETLAEPEVTRHAMVDVLPSYAVRGGAIYVVSPPLRHLPARVALLRRHLIAELPRALREERQRRPPKPADI